MKEGPKIRAKLRQAIRKFRHANPRATEWNDDQVVEAMLLTLAQQEGSRVRITGRQSDGKVIFSINLRADASDGSS